MTLPLTCSIFPGRTSDRSDTTKLHLTGRRIYHKHPPWTPSTLIPWSRPAIGCSLLETTGHEKARLTPTTLTRIKQITNSFLHVVINIPLKKIKPISSLPNHHVLSGYWININHRWASKNRLPTDYGMEVFNPASFHFKYLIKNQAIQVWKFLHSLLKANPSPWWGPLNKNRQ